MLVPAIIVSLDTNMTEEEIKLIKELVESVDFSVYAAADMPEGTIVTEPYFSDVLVPVEQAR